MKNPLMAALVAALSLASHSANAQEYAGQRYVGFSIGQTEYKPEFRSSIRLGGSVDAECEALGIRFTNCPSKDTGIKLYVGHNLHKNFAVEAGFIDFGEHKIDWEDPLTLYVHEKTNGNSLFVAGMGKIQVHPKATLFGKVGLHRWDIESEYKVFDEYGQPRDWRITGGDDGVDLLYGIGGEFALFPNEKIKLRMEYETFTVGDDFDYDFEFISIGIVYAF